MIGQELSRILCKYIFTLQNFCYRHRTIWDKGEVAGLYLKLKTRSLSNYETVWLNRLRKTLDLRSGLPGHNNSDKYRLSIVY